MTHAPAQKSVFTTTEFDRWWEAQGSGEAAATGLELTEARALSWHAWRAGREQLNEAMSHLRLQPISR
jgi:hypothetical protein